MVCGVFLRGGHWRHGALRHYTATVAEGRPGTDPRTALSVLWKGPSSQADFRGKEKTIPGVGLSLRGLEGDRAGPSAVTALHGDMPPPCGLRCISTWLARAGWCTSLPRRGRAAGRPGTDSRPSVAERDSSLLRRTVGGTLDTYPYAIGRPFPKMTPTIHSSYQSLPFPQQFLV